MLVDSHGHLDTFGEHIPDVLATARARGVAHIVISALSLPNSRQGVEIARANPQSVSCAPGLHPGNALDAETRAAFRDLILANRDRIRLIGGILNYHGATDEEKEEQLFVFREFVRLAREFDSPMTIHAKGPVFADVTRVLQEEHGGSMRKSLHGFDGSEQDAQRFLELGFFMSVGLELLSSDHAEHMRRLVQQLPLDRILLETDALYRPQREVNPTPALLPDLAERVAELKGVSVEELARETTRNFEALTGARLSVA